MFRFVNQILAHIILNGFFQAVLFVLIFLARLLRHTLRHDGIDYGDYIEQLTYG
ncbi:MAG: hypothetical protein IMF11_05770 [Proteobacteria bacterium]|nr:hypothetical protein [Pseudomonadota bacterium]